jgi:ABC-type transporter Mla MlaB component
MASRPRYHPREVGVVDHEIVIRLTETELGGPQVEAVGKRLLRLVAEGDGRNIRLDCGAVKIVTAAGLGMLVAVHRRLQERGGELTVCDLPPLGLRSVRGGPTHEGFGRAPDGQAAPEWPQAATLAPAIAGWEG